MIILRDDQITDVGRLSGAFAAGFKSPILVRATGTGKTVIFSHVNGKIAEKGKRGIIMVHRDELMSQVSETLTAFNVRHGLIASGAMYDRRLRVHVASVMTVVRRLDRVEVPDYVTIDEAHHGAAATWLKIINYWRSVNPNLRVIGVSATPELLSGTGLGVMFDEMIVGLQTREGIDTGVLSPYRLFAPKTAVDLSGVRMRGGDYAKNELAGVMDKPSIIGSAVVEYRKLMDGAPAVAFCVSVEHAEHTAEQFRSAGYRAASIDGTMDRDTRRALVRDFSRGAINVLTSVDVISEGFDVKGIVGAILLRPTHSLALYLQQVGRALRVAPGKDAAIILDHTLCSSRHGMPDDEREWSLLGSGNAKKKSEGDISCRQCQKCYAISPAAASKCRDCGTIFPIKIRKIEEVAGELSEVEVARIKRDAVRERAAAQTLEDLIRLGESRSYRNPAKWAAAIFDARKKKAAV